MYCVAANSTDRGLPGSTGDSLITERMNLNRIRLAGWIGLAGALLCGIGEFLLHFDSHRLGLGETGFDFMINTSEGRLNAGHFFAVVGVPLYFAGVWHIAEMIKPAGEKMSKALFLIGSFGFLYGAMWMSSRSSIGSLVHHAELIKDTNLIELYNLRCESLLSIIRITTLVISVIYIKQVLTGKSRYPKWMAATSPVVLLVMNFIILLIAPEIGRFVAPIALNVGFAVLFLLSLTFGDTRANAAI